MVEYSYDGEIIYFEDNQNKFDLKYKGSLNVVFESNNNWANESRLYLYMNTRDDMNARSLFAGYYYKKAHFAEEASIK